MPPLNIEEVLRESGGFGKYQKLLCFLIVSSVSGVCAFTFSAHMLSLVTPDHWCANAVVTSLREQLPLSVEDGKKFSLPPMTRGPTLFDYLKHDDNDNSRRYSQCQRYDGDLAATYIKWVTNGKPTFLPQDDKFTVYCDDGWEYNTTVLYNTVISEYDLVCRRNWIAVGVHVIFWLGAALGVYVAYLIVMRFGRQLGILSMIFITFVGYVLTLSASGLILILASRALIGAGYFSLRFQMIIQALAFLPESNQHWAFTCNYVTQTAVYLLMVYSVLIVDTWWWFFLPGAVLSLTCAILTFRFVYESPWWLLEKNRTNESCEILQKIAQVNGCELNNKDTKSIQQDFMLFEALESPVGNVSIHLCCWKEKENQQFDLLEPHQFSKLLCKKHSTILNIICIVSSICYYSHWHQCISETLTQPTASRVFSSCFYPSLAEVTCCILLYTLSQCYACQIVHKLVVFLSLLVTAGLSFTGAMLHYEDGSITQILLNVFIRLGVTTAVVTATHLLYKVNNTKHFTVITSLAVTECLVAATMVVVPIISVTNQYNQRFPILIFGFVALIGMVISLGLPESNFNKHLEKNDMNGKVNDKYNWMDAFLLAYKSFRSRKASRLPSSNISTTVVSSVPYNQLQFT